MRVEERLQDGPSVARPILVVRLVKGFSGAVGDNLVEQLVHGAVGEELLQGGDDPDGQRLKAAVHLEGPVVKAVHAVLAAPMIVRFRQQRFQFRPSGLNVHEQALAIFLGVLHVPFDAFDLSFGSRGRGDVVRHDGCCVLGQFGFLRLVGWVHAGDVNLKNCSHILPCPPPP